MLSAAICSRRSNTGCRAGRTTAWNSCYCPWIVHFKVMSTISRQLVRVLLAVAVLGALIFALKRGIAPDPAPRVSVIRPVRQDFSSFVTTNGKVEPVEPRSVQARLTTFIETVLVKEGDSVRRQQLLMTLDAGE